MTPVASRLVSGNGSVCLLGAFVNFFIHIRMHERTLVPFLVSPVDFFEALQFFPYFSILLLRCLFCGRRRVYEFLESCVAATTATVSEFVEFVESTQL